MFLESKATLLILCQRVVPASLSPRTVQCCDALHRMKGIDLDADAGSYDHWHIRKYTAWQGEIFVDCSRRKPVSPVQEA